MNAQAPAVGAAFNGSTAAAYLTDSQRAYAYMPGERAIEIKGHSGIIKSNRVGNKKDVAKYVFTKEGSRIPGKSSIQESETRHSFVFWRS